MGVPVVATTVSGIPEVVRHAHNGLLVGPDQPTALAESIELLIADPALRGRLFSHIVRSLKPGGTLLLQGYTPRQLEHKTGGPSVLSHLYTEPMLRQALAGLDIVELRDYEADVQEGSGHRGRSALIGLVARRP